MCLQSLQDSFQRPLMPLNWHLNFTLTSRRPTGLSNYSAINPPLGEHAKRLPIGSPQRQEIGSAASYAVGEGVPEWQTRYLGSSVAVQFESSHLTIAMEAWEPASLKAMPPQSNIM